MLAPCVSIWMYLYVDFVTSLPIGYYVQYMSERLNFFGQNVDWSFDIQLHKKKHFFPSFHWQKESYSGNTDTFFHANKMPNGFPGCSIPRHNFKFNLQINGIIGLLLIFRFLISSYVLRSIEYESEYRTNIHFVYPMWNEHKPLYHCLYWLNKAFCFISINVYRL